MSHTPESCENEIMLLLQSLFVDDDSEEQKQQEEENDCAYAAFWEDIMEKGFWSYQIHDSISHPFCKVFDRYEFVKDESFWNGLQEGKLCLSWG